RAPMRGLERLTCFLGLHHTYPAGVDKEGWIVFRCSRCGREDRPAWQTPSGRAIRRRLRVEREEHELADRLKATIIPDAMRDAQEQIDTLRVEAMRFREVIGRAQEVLLDLAALHPGDENPDFELRVL